jgi:hypothetical protein
MAAIRTPSPQIRFLVLAILLALAACVGPRATASDIEVTVEVDGNRVSVMVPRGSTVQQVLSLADLTLGELDRVEPAGYTVVASGTLIHVIRVTESFEVESVVMPFERQTIRNESLPEGETRLLQPGRNGTQEITYRLVFEEGIEISRTLVKVSIIDDPKPEIIMIGTQSAFAPIAIEGTLAYASAGNAWVMRSSSGNRYPVVVSGDLDGQVFKLSPDGEWLLFSRLETDDDSSINSLWVISTQDPEAEPFELGVENVIHFADWSPTSPPYQIAYTTVESSPAAPGWQANNDLVLLDFYPDDMEVERTTLIPINAGGQYGWWGTTFAWAPNGSQLAYANPESVGIVNLYDPDYEAMIRFDPYQTLGDWAWVPDLAWSPDGTTLYFVDHGDPIGLEIPAASPVFDLQAMTLANGLIFPLLGRTGMFAHPSASPCQELISGECDYQVAFLQASSPLDSHNSRYRLMVMDRDASNRAMLFPPQGEMGLEPHGFAWSPMGTQLVLIYRQDLWIIDKATGTGQQVTGDGQAIAFDWKP